MGKKEGEEKEASGFVATVVWIIDETCLFFLIVIIAVKHGWEEMGERKNDDPEK